MNHADITQFLPSYLIPFISYTNVTLLVRLFIVLLAGSAALGIALTLARLRVVLKKKYTFLEVKPVYNTLQSPLSTAKLFRILHGSDKDRSLTDRILGVKQTISCELISQKETGIRYILRVPFRSASLIRKTLLSYLPGVEVNEVGDYLPESLNNFNSDGFFLLKELRLSKQFPLPLEDQNQLNQYDPISYLTGHMTKLKEREMAGMQVVYTPVQKGTHASLYRYTEKIKSLLMAGKDIAGQLYRGKFHRIYSALAFMISGDTKETVSQSKKELYNTVEDKISQPLFEATVRLFVTADSRESGVVRMNGLQSSFDTFSTPHQTLSVKHAALTKIRNSFLDSYRYFTLKNRLLSRSGNPVFSVSELASLYHLPYTATTKTEDLVKVRSPKLPSPLPLKSSVHNPDITFARNVYGESSVTVGLTLEERRRHMYIIGATGTGKTTALLHMIYQDMRNGKGIAVIDPHGDLTQRLLGVIPQERTDDIVYFNPYDIERPVSLNILELPEGLSEAELQREKDLIASGLISIFHKLYAARYTGPRMEHILRNTVLTALELENPTLMTVYKLLTDVKFRKKVTTSLPKGVLKDFWKNEFGKLGSFQKAEQISPITNKLGRFLTTAMTRNILSQDRSKLDFEDIINSGKILICDLSKGKIGEDVSSFLGSLVVTKIQLAAFRRVHDEQKNRKDFFLYIDEFQNFATPSFAQILSEARKYRLSAVLAHQTMSQIENRDLLRVILANVGSIVSFRTSNPSDEEMILPVFAPEVAKHEIASLPLYNFYMKINAVEPLEAFTGQIDDFTVENDEAVRADVINRSREKYGTEVPNGNGALHEKAHVTSTPDHAPEEPERAVI
jgi:hypothetical protein